MPLLGLLEKFWKERQPTRAWAVRHHPGFEAARAFLEASSEHQRHEDVKANRRVRLRLAVAVLALIVIVAGGFAFRLYLSNARLDAQSRVLAGQVIAARAANTTADTDLETRTQLAAESLRRQSTPDAQRLLLQSLFSLAAPLQNLAWPQDGDPAAPSSVAAAPSSVALSSDGRVLFAADVNRLRAFDASTGTALFAVAPPAAGVLTLLAGRHARRLVVFSLDSVHILDARTGTELASLPVAGLRAGTLSDDETTAAFVTRTAQVFVCHLSTNCSDMRVVGTTAFSPQDLALSADAAKLVVQGEEDGANERSFALYSTAPFALLKERVLPIAGTSLALAFDRDAVWVCTPTRFASFETFGDDLAPGVSERFPGEANRCAISEQRVVAQHADQTLRVWSDDGFQIGIAGGPVPASAMVALGGPHLAAVGERLRVWRVSRYGAVPSVTGGGTLVGAGTHVAQGTSRILVNLDSGQETTLRVPELPSSWRLAAVADSLQNVVFTNSNVEVLIGKPRVLAYVERDPSGAYVQKWRAAIPFVRGSGLGGVTSIVRRAFRSPSVTFAEGGRFLSVVTPGTDSIELLDLSNGKICTHAPGHQSGVRAGRHCGRGHTISGRAVGPIARPDMAVARRRPAGSLGSRLPEPGVRGRDDIQSRWEVPGGGRGATGQRVCRVGRAAGVEGPPLRLAGIGSAGKPDPHGAGDRIEVSRGFAGVADADAVRPEHSRVGSDHWRGNGARARARGIVVDGHHDGVHALGRDCIHRYAGGDRRAARLESLDPGGLRPPVAQPDP